MCEDNRSRERVQYFIAVKGKLKLSFPAAIDLVSTHEGIKKRYGFVYVDRDEFDLRTMKVICSKNTR